MFQPPNGEPADWVRRFGATLPTASRVLDVACGAGRHARFFAAAGHDVIAIDRDTSQLRALVADDVVGGSVLAIEADLEIPAYRMPARFDCVP